MPERVCLVTVHGIGFQQAPGDGVPGYADELHNSLRAKLGDKLGDDTGRDGGGPVYVRSEVDSSSSGLQAHDYWNNKEQFIPGLVEVLLSAAG